MDRNLGMTAWRAFLEAHAHVTELLEAELQAEKDLPLAWYDVLVHLQEAEAHRLRMTELARKVLLSKSGLTRLVDRMCVGGLVERWPDEADRRGRWVSLTGAGHDRLKDAAPIHLRGVREHFTSHLGEEAAKTLSASLGAIAEAADARRS
ncbi:MAG: MarR family winged helix-turn-helix transcriptional regulator [bacterium]